MRGIRVVGLALLLAVVVTRVAAVAQEPPTIPEDLQRTYGAFATAMVEGDADAAIEFYAADGVVLVDHEHVYRGRRAIRDGFLAEYLEVAAESDEAESGTEIGVDRVVIGEGVVTLAGQYWNQSGAAGVYSNTWERQADGSWKLAVSVLTFESSDRTPSRSSGGFACTQVLGFSQSMEWYAGLSLAAYMEKDTRPDLSALEPGAFLRGWQGRFFGGAAIEEWTDPDFPGWSGAHRRAHETPIHCGHGKVDRVVFNVSGKARSPDAWAMAVDSVADVIRAKFPAVREIVMQPVVGAPEGACPDVRAARNHRVIAAGIRRAADRGAITAGPDPKVAGCDQFSDALGHLTVEGAEHVRRILRKHYRPSTAVPAPTAAAQDTTLIVENGRVVVGDGTVLERGTVVISADRIVAVTVEPPDAPAPGARRIDASGKTVLPGLIDTHVHLLLEDDDPPVPASDRELARFVERRLPGRLREYLERGFTTIMSTGDFWPHVGEVRARLSARDLEGPRLMVVGPIFTDPGSHPAYSVCEEGEYRNPWCRRHLAVEVDDPQAARAAVRRLAEGGVDAIKAVYELEPPVTRAIAEEAHRHGLTLYMHPPEDQAAMLPLESWNVDRFVHVAETGSTKLADRVAETMVQHAASASTTLAVYAGDSFQAAGFRGRCDEHLGEGRRRALSGVQRTTRALADTGILAFGTDAPMLPPSRAIECELQLLVETGLDEEEILAALTSQAAAHIGRASDLGTLEAGKLADVVVVEGDPLSDVLALRKVDVVISRGEVVVEDDNGRPR